MILRILLSIILFLLMATDASSSGKDYFWNKGRGYKGFRYGNSDGVTLHNRTDAAISDSITLLEPTANFMLTFTAREDGGKPRIRILDGKTPGWGFFISDGKEKIWITIDRDEKKTLLSSESGIKITAIKNGETILNTTVATGIDLSAGPNIWRLSLSRGTLALSTGNKGLQPVAEIPFGEMACKTFGYAAAPGATLDFYDISLRSEKVCETRMHVPFDESLLNSKFKNSKDSLEGVWAIFDHTLEETLLKKGGDYNVAIVKNGDIYDMIYLSGARVNNSQWHPGMSKGRLLPTSFDGIYHVEWIDVEGKMLSHEIEAQKDGNRILQIQFPYQSSVIRLRKIRP